MIFTRYGYMESKEGTAALQTEEGLRKQIKKAVMDFQVQLTFNQLCCIGKYEITGVCGPQSDRICGCKDTRDDGHSEVEVIPNRQQSHR